MATNVGSLNINIQAGTAQFDEAIGKVKDGLKSAVVTGSALGTVIGDMFTKLTEKAGELAAQMYEFARSVIETDEQMGNLAQVTGTTSEKFSVLAYAGKLANVSTDELSQSMSHLAKQMALAASGNAQAIDLFQALGVRVTDANGKIRDTADVFADIAKKFSQYRDDANKTDLAQQALGKSSSRLIPYLNSLGANFSEITQKAKDLNVVTGTDAAQQASKFSENLADLQEHLRGTARTILNPLLPSINAFIEGIGDSITAVAKLIEKLDDLGKKKITVGEQQYQVVDVVKAADQIKKEQDEEQVDRLKALWGFLADKTGLNLGAWWSESVKKVLDAIPKPTGDLKELQPYIEAAKQAREEAEKNKPKPTDTTAKPSFKLPPDPELAKAAQMYQERLKHLLDNIAAQRTLNEVIGQGSEAQAVANGLNEAENQIREINAPRIEKHIKLLTEDEKQTLRNASVASELTKLQTTLGASFEEQTQSAELALAQQKNLTAAAGQGADAMQAAQLQNLELAARWNKALDLLGDKGPAVLKQLSITWKEAADSQREAQNREQIQQIQNQTKALEDQKDAIDEMTAAIFQSDAAQQLAERHALEARQRQEVDLAKQAGANQAAIDKLKQQQKSTLDTFDAQQKLDTLQRAKQDMQGPEEAYQQRKTDLEDEAKALAATKNGVLSYGQALAYAAQQQAAAIELQQKWIQLLLLSNKASDGVSAFFRDMQIEAITTARIVYDALHNTFDKLTDELTNLITGGKADFKAMLQDIGKQLVHESLQGLIQKGIGAVGKALGINIGPKPDGSSADLALWVRTAAGGGGGLGGVLGTGGTGGSGGGDESDSEDSSGGLQDIISGLGSKLGSMMSGVGSAVAGVLKTIFSALIPHAAGGMVSPDKAYLVGERGPEILTGANGRMFSADMSRRILMGGKQPSVHYYNIDARGTDPVLTEQRTRMAIIAAHNSAVMTSQNVSQERSLRTPPTNPMRR